MSMSKVVCKASCCCTPNTHTHLFAFALQAFDLLLVAPVHQLGLQVSSTQQGSDGVHTYSATCFQHRLQWVAHSVTA